MATYTIEFQRFNEPIVGAEVTATGERIHGITDANGRVSATIDYNAPIAVHLVVKTATSQAGIGPQLLEPDAVTIIRLL